MEEDKAAAYYDELSRKGQGAARFKQGLGFSSTSSASESKAPPSRGSALPSASSFLSSFVRASSPSKASELEKQAQLESIQNKLKKKPTSDKQEKHSRASEKTDRDRDRDRDRHSRRRSRSRERHRDRDRDRDRDRKRRRSVSPRERRRSEKSRGEDKDRDRVDFSKLIEGYDKMTPAERVKAKMKLQLAETAEKDETKGMGSGWERFEFNKDAPLDDEEIEAAEDDKALVKQIGQSFRFSAVETRREEQIKAAHDDAMFGASSILPSISTESEPEMEDNKEENGPVTSLLSDKVLAKQQGSWRDRARKV